MCLDDGISENQRPALGAHGTKQKACRLDGIKRKEEGSLPFCFFGGALVFTNPSGFSFRLLMQVLWLSAMTCTGFHVSSRPSHFDWVLWPSFMQMALLHCSTPDLAGSHCKPTSYTIYSIYGSLEEVCINILLVNTNRYKDFIVKERRERVERRRVFKRKVN